MNISTLPKYPVERCIERCNTSPVERCNIPIERCVERCNTQPVRANQLASKGFNFTGRGIAQLYEEYNWFIRHDKTPAVKAFLKIKEDPKTMDKFLNHILNTEDRSYEFIDSIARSGKELTDITNGLIDKIGNDSETLLTFWHDNVYHKAYKKYITKRYNDAHTMSELLRIRPDWTEEALMSKYQNLKPGSSFRIGKIPCELPKDMGAYDLIIDHLRPNMQRGYKVTQNIPDLQIGNRTYKFNSFTEGRSDKNVFCITTPEQKKFVFKIGDPQDRGLDKPFGLGTLAKIDTYLTTNRSKNSAPLRFYDHNRNVAIYTYVEHCPLELLNKPSIQEVNQRLGDFRKLGLYYNDTVGHNNYFELKEVHKSMKNGDIADEIEKGINNNEWISVDNDHVTFNNRLHPQIREFHRELPNMMNMCC